jgi:phospholipid transport system substrate-binding protein
MNFTRSLRGGLLLGALAIFLTGPAAADPKGSAVELPTAPPSATIETLHVALLNIMKDADALGYQGRFDHLAPVLPEAFDLPFMAQKSVGRYWKRANEAERERLVNAFADFTTANYAGNFDGYSGQKFETLGEENSTHGTVLVLSRLIDPDGELVQLNYRVRPVNGEWKIIDVYLNGTVSELALRRSEYSSLIKREGLDSLIVALNDKVSDLAGDSLVDPSP